MTFNQLVRRKLTAVAAAVPLILAADPALAYVGPGAGLTLVGSLVAVAAAALLVVGGLVLFPVRMAMRKMREARQLQEGLDADAD